MAALTLRNISDEMHRKIKRIQLDLGDLENFGGDLSRFDYQISISI